MQRILDWKELRCGDVGFYVGDTGVSLPIEALTHRHDLGGLNTPSHAFLVREKGQTIEALSKTKSRPLSVYEEDFKRGRAYIYRPTSPPHLAAAAMQGFVRNWNGAAYGWLQILAFMPILIIRKLFGFDPPNLMPAGAICSEDALIYLRILRSVLSTAGNVELALLLGWTLQLQQNTTDPALLMACCQRDGVPASYSGERP